MRLIDADEIPYKNLSEGHGFCWVTFWDWIKKMPTADAVEVVRCEDCIHNHTKTWNQGKRDKPSCRFTDLMRSNKFYCGFGERADT